MKLEEAARVVAKAVYDEKEERERIVAEEKATKDKKKQEFKTKMYILYWAGFFAGLYMIWNMLEPLISLANW